LEIETAARLHLSLIDLNGSNNRIDGGIGISINDPKLNIECVENDSKDEVTFNDSSDTIITNDVLVEKILETSKLVKNYYNIDSNFTFNIQKIYPLHHGLGLGTQLALSIAKLITSCHSIDATTYSLAEVVHRGGTSGIGVETFNSGGLIVDGGHKMDLKKRFAPSSTSRVSPPPVLARYDFPEKWNIILAIPSVSNKVSGKMEVSIFDSYTPIAQKDVEKIAYLTLMKLMPSVLEEDLNDFSSAVNQIQDIGFKRVERDLQSSSIQEVLDYMDENDIPCRGMSSFGPTCFGITDRNVSKLEKDLLDYMGCNSKVILTNGKNNGATIK